ncbi:hypothetical protein ACQY0O_007670 [Thecaphora frezii]
MPPSLSDNLTLRILRDAAKGGYGINAQCCYDAQSIVALVRAAEQKRSPAICQLFPVTLAQFGKPFLRFVLDTCHSASVPISVHLDHAANAEDIGRALQYAVEGVAFDSIMIDCSHFDTDDENIQMALPFVQRAHELGIAVEVELGRLAGGEAGVRVIESGLLTKPEKAQRFLGQLGAEMLAPSIGNIHGRYVNPPDFRLELLEELQRTVGPGTEYNATLVLHGTDDLPDQLFRDCIERGAIKINVNSWARDPQIDYWSKHLQDQPLPDVYDGGMKEFEKVCCRFFDLFESSGKA